MSLYQHILAAVDLGENSINLLRQAGALATLCDARLTVLHVVDYLPASDVDVVMLPEDNREEVLITVAEKRLHQLLEQVLPGNVAEELVVSGRSKVEILRLAAQQKADLIVVGAHGRHGLRGLLGSTTDRVLHQAACDVLTVQA